MDCKEAMSVAEDALDGALSGAAGRAFEAHVRGCAKCRAFFEAEKAEFARWRAALADGAAGRRLPADFADRLVAAVCAAESAPRRFWVAGRSAFFKVAASIAVTLGLSVAVFNAVSSRSRRPPSDDELVAEVREAGSGWDFESRCERVMRKLEKDGSRKAATKFLANAFATCGV